MVRKVILYMCMIMLPLTAFPQTSTIAKEGAKAAGKILRNTIKGGKNSAKTESKIAGGLANTMRANNRNARIPGSKLLSNPDVLPKNISKGQISSLTTHLNVIYGNQLEITDDFVLKVYNLCARKGLKGEDMILVLDQFKSYSQNNFIKYKELIKKSKKSILRETEAKELKLLRKMFTNSEGKVSEQMNGLYLPRELIYYKPSKEVSIGEFAHSAIRHSVSSHSKRRTFFSDEYMKTHLQEDMIKLKQNRNIYFVNKTFDKKGLYNGDCYIMRYDKPIGKDMKGNDICDIMFCLDKEGKMKSSYPLSEIVKGIKMKEYSFRDLYNKIPVTPANW